MIPMGEVNEQGEGVGQSNGKWSFSTKLVITLVFNAVVGTFWVSGLKNTIENNSKEIARLQTRVEALEQDVKGNNAKSESQNAASNTRFSLLELRVQTIENHK